PAGAMGIVGALNIVIDRQPSQVEGAPHGRRYWSPTTPLVAAFHIDGEYALILLVELGQRLMWYVPLGRVHGIAADDVEVMGVEIDLVQQIVRQGRQLRVILVQNDAVDEHCQIGKAISQGSDRFDTGDGFTKAARDSAQTAGRGGETVEGEANIDRQLWIFSQNGLGLRHD